MAIDQNELLKLRQKRQQRRSGQTAPVNKPVSQTEAQSGHRKVDRRGVDRGSRAVSERTRNQRKPATQARERAQIRSEEKRDRLLDYYEQSLRKRPQAPDGAMDLVQDSLSFGGGSALADAVSYGRHLVEDNSWREPNRNWETWQVEEFVRRYSRDPEDAYAYGQQVNDYLKAGELQAQQKQLGETNPLLATGVGLVTAPLGMADPIEKLLEKAARGTITQRGHVTPSTLSRDLTGAVAQNLNEKHGTIDEDVFLLGGKGLGDVYGIFNSAVQSMGLGNTVGSFGTLATYFGQSAGAGMEEIKARGGSDEQAILYGLLSGAFEAGAEYLPLNNLLKGGDAVHYTLKSFMGNALKQAGFEGTEEAVTSIANGLADRLIMGDKSSFAVQMQEYMAQGMDEEAATRKAWLKFAGDTAFDFLGGALSGAGSMAVQTGPSTVMANHQTRRAYTPEMEAGLLELAMETEEGSRPYELAQKYQGEKLTGGQINQLAGVYEEYADQQDADALTEDAAGRLEALEAENDTAARAIAKTIVGQELNRAERKALEGSAEAKKVLQDMQAEQELPATPDTPDAGYPWKPGTPMVRYYEQNRDPLMAKLEQAERQGDSFGESEGMDQAEPPRDSEQLPLEESPRAPAAKMPRRQTDTVPWAEHRLMELKEQETDRQYETAYEAELERLREAAAVESGATANAAETDESEFLDFARYLIDGEEANPAEPSGISEQLTADNAAAVLDNTVNAAAEESSVVPETVAKPVAKPVEAAVENVENPATETVDSAPAVEENAEDAPLSRTVEEVAEGYGNQAGEVRKMYQDGQDVGAFEQGVRAAWELGNSGIPMERAVSSPRTQGITEHQRKQAYLLGQGAARLAAQGKATANAKAATGGTVRRRGAVKGQGVSIQDLSKTFNDPQKSAYKLLNFYAEVTGVDVVLYKGKQEQETGRFAHGENTVYIDISAGTNGWDATDLGAYTMMRTFSHEFTHFVEKWNPTAYNDLREAVFAEMEKNGSDPEALVELAMQEQGLTFDQASREVVAEALTDILPESQFVQTLAQKHKSLFEKLKERLEAFVAELKAHWKKLTGNNSREAVALKRQVGDALEYAEEIVQLFDRVAGEAVEAYQATVMGEEVPAAEVATKETEESDSDEPEVTPAAENGEGSDTEPPEQLQKYMKKFGKKHPMHLANIDDAVDGVELMAGSTYLLFRIDKSMLKWEGFNGLTTKNLHKFKVEQFITGANKRLTEQPMIGTLDKLKVAEFDTPEGKLFFNWDLLRYFDGNDLYYSYKQKVIKAVDPTTGKLVGFVMGMKVNEKNITDKKPGKMKSFGKAVQPKAQKTETPKQEPQTITDDRFTIESTKGGTVYVTFSGKPDEVVRNVLKGVGFKWSPKKKAWYGSGDIPEIAGLVRGAFDMASSRADMMLKQAEAAAREWDEEHGISEEKADEPDFEKDPYGWAEYQLNNDMHYGPIDLGAYEANIQPVNYDDRLFFYRGTLHAYKSKSPVEVGEEVCRTGLSEKREDVVKDMVRALKELGAYGKDAAKTEETAPDAQEMEGDTPSEKLANAVLSEYLSKDRVIDSMALYALADRAFGGTQGEGAYNRKDAYDALELAVNKHLLTFAKDMNSDILKAQQSVRKLEELLRFLPTQTVRTQEQQDFQQFSTPPNIAYLAAWAGNVQPGEMVLEPSAGIGGIAAFAKSWGAEVAVNELSERRLGILKSMGFDHVFNENAEQLDNVLPDNIKPTLVLMNPPFSSTAGRTKHNKTSNAERHIDQALQRLSGGGRLVAILGKGMNDADYRKYWDKVRKEYTIRANLSIDGSNYKKYGTTWGVQLVVIDKTGPQTGQTITGSHTDLTEVPAVLEEIRNDRKAVEGPGSDGGAAAGSMARSDGRDGVSEAGSAGGRVRDPGKPARSAGKRSDRSHEGGSGVRDHADDGGLRKSGADSGRSEVGRDVRQDLRQDHRADHEPAGAGELARPEPQRTRRLTEEPEQREDDGVYATFVLPDVPIPGGRKHPATLVESAAMSAVSMPKATYTPRLPAEVVKNNLSDAQMVTVTYAGQAHNQMLPDGSRKGFFIGDGTGVGKGRQIAGIILDNFMQGRTKAVWVSKNGDLYGDAIRDWTGTTGRSKGEVLNHSKTKLGASIAADSGILFTTYPMLRSSKNNVTRLDQIVSWLGEDFDGVIAFDEAHNMGNLYGRKSKMGKSKGSEMAKAGVELQRRLPKARIVYVSATAATEVDNLAYAERLGLWGKGTAFANAQDFISKIGSSGLSAMELVVRDMKAMGSYVARSISYQGVAYDTIEHTLDENQTIIYNTMSSAWQTVMQNVHKALELTGGKNNSHARQLALGQFYSSMQRFYNQALTSMSMPSVIADMRRELEAGRSCVLQIVNTNEAQQNKALAQAKAENLELDDLDLTPRESLIGYLETCFPVQEFEEYTDENGKTQSRPVVNSKGEPVISRQAVAMREGLIEQVKSMAIPDGPMEMLFDAFGTEMVAENTGRSRRVVPKQQSDGSYKRVEERRTLNSRTADVQAFQDGKKRILVFSDAGGTGKSYHADRSEKNQQQRIHYVLQPGWSASNAVQGFGRTHRSNEASAPIYKLVTTNIKGQKRFTSTIARRLDQLGALTKGQRDTGSGMFGAKDNLETDLARDSLREFYKRLGSNRIKGIDGMKTLDRLGLKEKFTDDYGSFKMDENAARDISTFLNRILALEVDEQNTVFDAFTSIYEMELEAAIQAGTLDTGMENVKADKIEILDDKIIREDGNGGAATHYIQAKTYKKPRITTTVAEAETQRSGFVGIYETDNGSVRAVYRMADKTTEWGQVTKQYRLVGPNRDANTTVWQENTLAKRAKLLDKKDWQKAWDKEVQQVPEYNEDTLHMLTGALLPIWDKLPQEGTTKVKRLIAADGRTYLGRQIPATQIDLTLRQFQTNRTAEKLDAKTVMDRALQKGEHFRLTRERAEIFRSRVSGEWRLEIRQTNNWQLQRYSGIIRERINFQDRFFIPKSEAGEKLLSDLLEHNPVRDSYQDDQLQVRRIALTDRQVLELAAEKINPAKFDKAGQDAFRIFSERLERLRTLQEDRKELGQLYKEQQFGPNGDRKAAADTLEKMHRLDAAIEAAADKVLEAEKGTALRAVLQEARKIVQKDQADHDEAVLKEYRQKRNESAAQRKYRRAVQREVKELQDFILHPDTKRMKLCPEFLQKPVLEFLSTIDQSSKRKLSGGGDTQADQRFANRLADLTEILEKAAGKDDDGNVDIFEGYLDLPGDFLARVKKFSSDARKLTEKVGDRNVVNKMTAAQLHELLEVLTGMKTLIRNANTFHSNAMFQHISQAGGETVTFTRKHRDWSKARGKLAALGNMESWVFWKNVRPALIFQRFGKAGLSILQELMDGQDKLARNTKAVVDFAEKTYTDKEVKAWEKDTKRIRLSGEDKSVRLTVAQIMGLYCMAKREQAIGHLTHGGFVVQDENGGIRKVHMTIDDLGVFSAALSNRQRAVADKLQKFMSERGGEWGNYVTLHRFGIKAYGEEFYYPLATYDEKRPASIDKPEGSDLHALLNMSFTKQLKPKAKNAVMAYSIFDVFADHMGAMAQYNAMALPVLDAVKWLNWSQSTVNEKGFEDTVGVKTELRRVFGIPPAKRGKGGNISVSKGYAEHFILNLLKSYNSTSPQATPNDKPGLGMLHRYNRSQVGFNRSVVLKQPLAIFRAMQVLSPASIAKGANPAAVAQGLREMLKYSGIAIWKDLGFYDVNVSKGMGKLIRRDSGILDKITDASMFKAEWADKITWAMIWNGCKAQCGGNMKKAAELFNKVIYESQVVDSVLTKTEYMRDQGFISRYLSSFMSEPVTAVSPLLNDVFLMNMEMQRKGGSFQTAWQKHGKHFVHSTAVYAVTGIITAVASALIAAWRDDDDYQDFDEKFLEAMDGAIGEELNPFTKLPLVSNVAKGLDAAYQAMAKGEEPWLAMASGLPMTEIIEYTVDGGKILHDLISGEDTNYTWYGAVRKLLQAFSGATGTPAATLSREVVDTWNNIVGRMAPSLKVKTYERSESEELRDAFLAGYLTEEEASEKIRELVAGANGDKDKLKELGFSSIKDEDDIYWKLRSWEGGSEWSKYDALAQAMANGEDISEAMDELTTHGVKEKTVRSQIRSIVGQWLEQGAVTPEEAEGLLVRYGDRDSEEAGAAVQKWRCEIDTGIPYSGIKEAYLDGEITETEAKRMYVKYGGYTQEKAEDAVEQWRAERDTGIAYSDIDDALLEGRITEREAARMYETYGGMEPEKAAEAAHRLDFIRRNPGCEDISSAAVEDYETHCEGAGITARVYYDAWKQFNATRSIKDDSGKTITSKRDQVMEQIHAMNLTSKQKDALYFAFGYAESKLWDTPWH